MISWCVFVYFHPYILSIEFSRRHQRWDHPKRSVERFLLGPEVVVTLTKIKIFIGSLCVASITVEWTIVVALSQFNTVYLSFAC